MQENVENLHGKYPEFVPLKLHQDSPYILSFDSDIPDSEKDQSDLENKNLRTWNLNSDHALKKQSNVFFKPSYGLFPKVVSDTMTMF
jgi:hypothetical protein